MSRKYFVKNNFKKICIVLLISLKFTQVVCQFALPIEDASRTMCPSAQAICSDNSPHFLCSETVAISKSCSGFEPINMTNNIKKQFIDGHNGIRNKVAEDFHIANMNLLYWSRELETVARNYLKLCKIKHDPCQYIGINNLPVNTNILFRSRHLIDRWPSRAVRQWYLELGAEVTTGAEFLARSRRDKTYAVNFSQMVWPKSEFLGCSAAKMFQGYLLVCYYYPPNEKLTALNPHAIFVGKSCTRCPRLRPTCSRIFNGLCGVDILYDSAETLALHKILYTILFVIFWTL